MRPWTVPAALVVGVFAVHLACPVSTPFDSKWSVPTAQSILREGDTDIDEYARLVGPEDYFAVETVRGRRYGTYPIGATLLALPAVLAAGVFVDPIAVAPLIERIVGSLAVALTTLFVFFIGRRALIPALVFAFCTSAWSTASRALWQHGPSMLMLSIALYLLLNGRIALSALPLAFSYVVRPTNSISILVLTIYVFVRHREHFRRYLLWALAVAVPFVAYNLAVYHAPLPSYYMMLRDFHPTAGSFGEGLVGGLVSPSRGLFVFSPVLAFAFLGVRRERLDGFLLAILALHWILISTWRMWWAGHSYGPRLYADMLPYFAYFLVRAVERMPRRAWIAFGFLALVSLFIHARGATSWAVHEWNSTPVDIGARPSRVWSLRDIQFLRGL